MKIISVGDLHGNNIWKTIDPELYDKIIFAGDYTDSFHLTDSAILDNLLDVIEFRKAYPDKVILLLGNHDVDNYMVTRARCSGFRPDMYPTLNKVFNDNKDLFQVAYQIDVGDEKYLWTHAGVHTGWYYHRFSPRIKDNLELKELPLADQLNNQFEERNYTLFDIDHYRGGYQSVGGIFWCDKRLSEDKPLRFYHQIVGHTRIPVIEKFEFNVYTSITFIDCIEGVTELPEFHILEL